jgi:transaldolase
MQEAIARTRKTKNVKIVRTSTREVFNVVEADAIGCDITASADSMKKLSGLGTKTAAEFSLGVVKSFREDTLVAGLRVPVPASRDRVERPDLSAPDLL